MKEGVQEDGLTAEDASGFLCYILRLIQTATVHLYLDYIEHSICLHVKVGCFYLSLQSVNAGVYRSTCGMCIGLSAKFAMVSLLKSGWWNGGRSEDNLVTSHPNMFMLSVRHFLSPTFKSLQLRFVMYDMSQPLKVMVLRVSLDENMVTAQRTDMTESITFTQMRAVNIWTPLL